MRFKVQQVVLVLQAIQASGVGKCLWLHGNTEVGVVGVLEAGKILRSTSDGLQLPGGQHALGFCCGRAIVAWPAAGALEKAVAA